MPDAGSMETVSYTHLVLCFFAGMMASYFAGTPAGASIVMVQFGIFILAAGAAALIRR